MGRAAIGSIHAVKTQRVVAERVVHTLPEELESNMENMAAARDNERVAHLNHSTRPTQDAASSTHAAGRSDADKRQALSAAISICDSNGRAKVADTGSGGRVKNQLDPIHYKSKIVHNSGVEGVRPIQNAVGHNRGA